MRHPRFWTIGVPLVILIASLPAPWSVETSAQSASQTAAPAQAASTESRRAFDTKDWYKVKTVGAPAMSPDGKHVAVQVTSVIEAKNNARQRDLGRRRRRRMAASLCASAHRDSTARTRASARQHAGRVHLARGPATAARSGPCAWIGPAARYRTRRRQTAGGRGRRRRRVRRTAGRTRAARRRASRRTRASPSPPAPRTRRQGEARAAAAAGPGTRTRR